MSDTCTVCGFPLSSGSLQSHLDELIERAETGKGGWIVTLNTEMLARGVRTPEYLDLIRQADLVVADGMPLVWATQKKKCPHPVTERTTGVDLVNGFLQRPDVPPYSVIGGVDPETTLDQYPGAREACKFLFTGKVDLSEKQVEDFCAILNERKIGIAFLALGVPKQDKLALAIREKAPHVVTIGVGGTFEILGPQGGRAPQWMQENGLEWLYRLSSEPQRLWKRYLIEYPLGIGLLIKDQLKTRAASQ